jgi:hypothetical protein
VVFEHDKYGECRVLYCPDPPPHPPTPLTPHFPPAPLPLPARPGVRIHRGVYEAAQELYADLLPLVRQHLATSPVATVAFTGHSLGGSLGTVLMLLLVARGELRPSNIAPCYTFGAPAVFCQVRHSCYKRGAGRAGGHGAVSRPCTQPRPAL